MEVTLGFNFILNLVGQRREEVVAGDSFQLVDRYGCLLHTARHFSVRHDECNGPGTVAVNRENGLEEPLWDEDAILADVFNRFVGDDRATDYVDFRIGCSPQPTLFFKSFPVSLIE